MYILNCLFLQVSLFLQLTSSCTEISWVLSFWTSSLSLSMHCWLLISKVSICLPSSWLKAAVFYKLTFFISCSFIWLLIQHRALNCCGKGPCSTHYVPYLWIFHTWKVLTILLRCILLFKVIMWNNTCLIVCIQLKWQMN